MKDLISSHVVNTIYIFPYHNYFIDVVSYYIANPKS